MYDVDDALNAVKTFINDVMKVDSEKERICFTLRNLFSSLASSASSGQFGHLNPLPLRCDDRSMLLDLHYKRLRGKGDRPYRLMNDVLKLLAKNYEHALALKLEGLTC